MKKCTCDWCTALGPIKACDVRQLIDRLTKLENAIEDMLNAKTATDCLKCLCVFRVLMERAA